MIKTGDKVELTFNPWSSYPQTTIKTVVERKYYESLNKCEQFFLIPVDDSLVVNGSVYERHNNFYIHPETKQWLPIITHIKIKKCRR